MTLRYTRALLLAAQAHEGQRRKGTAIPYITHPVAVAELVARHGGDEDQQIAALLHDVQEDAGAHHAAAIAEQFGARVLDIVEALTDGVPDATGTKAPWLQRKQAYLARLADKPDDVLLVAGCDKLHNTGDLLRDLETIGSTVFGRFNASQTQTLWYYAEMARVFTQRGCPTAEAMNRTVAALAARAG